MDNFCVKLLVAFQALYVQFKCFLATILIKNSVLFYGLVLIVFEYFFYFQYCCL